MTQPNPRLSSLFELEYPQSVGSYDSYEQAQAAVDYLADARFEVQNLAIVGTELKSMERVTGRRNWGTVLVAGLQNGLSTGLMVALILWFLQPQANLLLLLPGALIIGILIGIAFSAIAYAASRGRRDFNSISQIVAGKYEVLCEHKLAVQARELLAAMPGVRAAQFDPRNQPAPWQAGQPAAPQQGQPQHSYPGGQPSYPAPQAPPAGQQSYPAPQQSQPSGQQGYPGHQANPAPNYGAAPSAQSAPQADPSGGPFGNQPYGNYGATDGIGQAPTSEQDGRTPRGPN